MQRVIRYIQCILWLDKQNGYFFYRRWSAPKFADEVGCKYSFFFSWGWELFLETLRVNPGFRNGFTFRLNAKGPDLGAKLFFSHFPLSHADTSALD